MPTDAQLLAKISSDATGEALRALYRSYAGELYGFALNALGDRGTAEEVVQEVFTRAWRHAEAYDPTRGSVRTWLYQIARHAIIDTRRRAAVRPALALHEPRDEQDPEGLSIERAMLGWQVACALEKLTPEHRQVIRLAHVQGLPCARSPNGSGCPRGQSKAARGTRCVRCGWSWRRWGCGHDARPRGHRRVRPGRAGRGCREARARAPRDVPGVRGRPRRAGGHPGLLDLAVVTGATDEEPLPPAIEERLLDRFARERVERPTRRRWRPRIALGVGERAGGRGDRGRRSSSSALNFEKNGGRPPSQYRVAFEPIGPAPANASARAGLRTSRSGTVVRLWVNNLPPAGDVYEVFCDAPGWSASAGTFRVDAQGNAYVILTTAVKKGQYDKIRLVRREHLSQRRGPDLRHPGRQAVLNRGAARAYPLV